MCGVQLYLWACFFNSDFNCSSNSDDDDKSLQSFLFQIIRHSKMRKNLYENPVRFKSQKYEKLQKHLRDVLKAMYNDPIFPPTPSSIGNLHVDNVKWRRPSVSIIFQGWHLQDECVADLFDITAFKILVSDYKSQKLLLCKVIFLIAESRMCITMGHILYCLISRQRFNNCMNLWRRKFQKRDCYVD